MSASDLRLIYKRGLWIGLACIIASVTSLVFFDQYLSVYFSDSGLEEFWLLNRTITDVGLSTHYFLFSAILFTLLFVWGKYAKEHPAWRRSLQIWTAKFFVSLITSGLTIMILKFAFGRMRPHQTSPVFDPYVFNPFSFHWHNQSFPSGHSQVVFCVATMLSLLFPRGAVLFFILAAALSFTRIVTHNHFLSDCIMGAFLGWFVTMLTCARLGFSFGAKLPRS